MMIDGPVLNGSFITSWKSKKMGASLHLDEQCNCTAVSQPVTCLRPVATHGRNRIEIQEGTYWMWRQSSCPQLGRKGRKGSTGSGSRGKRDCGALCTGIRGEIKAAGKRPQGP
eukprot:gb/GECG01014519.1/.p1 GENE.gb/GECG01014519.1/~~gb/GECG01014519.1/.p1  ORF type:complete len:113 (+),score=6.93 gb/GECG01014519.1/:1-339(+)